MVFTVCDSQKTSRLTSTANREAVVRSFAHAIENSIQSKIIRITNLISLIVRTLTCSKLTHCLFDFDCKDLNVYEDE